MKKVLFYALIALCSGVIIYSSYRILRVLQGYKKAEDTYNSAREQYVSEVQSEEPPTPEKTTAAKKAENPEASENQESPESAENSETKEAEETEETRPDYSEHEHLAALSLLNVPFNYILMPEYVLDFESLQALNPDVSAWIRIKDTKIDYPVVQGEDNSKYLRVGADGQALNAGAIFIDYRNDSPFNDPVTIIYGHNQRNHAIFHDLLGYRDEAFLEAHPYIEIYLPDGSSIKYQVFAAGLIDAIGSNYRLNFGSDEEVLTFFRQCVDRSEVHLDVDLSANDRIIMLSTCTNDYDDTHRMVVCARKISTD